MKIEQIKKVLQVIFPLFATTSAILILIQGSINLPNRFTLIVLFLIFCLICWSNSQISLDDSYRKRLIDTISYIPCNIWLLFFGNIEQGNILKQIQQSTMTLQESMLFGKLIDTKDNNLSKIFIFFSHKGDESHLVKVGNFDNYRIPGFPFDEAELIIRLSYFIASKYTFGWSGIKIICSCCYSNIDKNDVNFGTIIVGSSKSNKCCKNLMAKINTLEDVKKITRDHYYIFKLNEENTCYLKAKSVGDSDLIPTAIDPENQNTQEILTDYALIMRIPDILSGETINFNSPILLLAGCKVAGQFAITDWISNNTNLINLIEKYNSQYFYVILEVKYNFVPQGIPFIQGSPMVCKDSRNNLISGAIQFS